MSEAIKPKDVLIGASSSTFRSVRSKLTASSSLGRGAAEPPSAPGAVAGASEARPAGGRGSCCGCSGILATKNMPTADSTATAV